MGGVIVIKEQGEESLPTRGKRRGTGMFPGRNAGHRPLFPKDRS